MTALRIKIGAPILILALLIVGCETTGGPGPKAAIGGLGGAAAGGLFAATAGGSAAGIAAGTIIGGLIGGVIGDRLDAADRRQADRAAAHAFETRPTGSSVAWHNPDSGRYGSVTPTRTYQRPNGQYCREYQQTVTIDGRPQKSYGTACRRPDGSWRIVN